MENAIVAGNRMFVALRKAGPTSGKRSAYHAVTPQCRMALCTAEPGVGSGWAEPPADRVTCRMCIARMQRLQAA